MQAAMRWVGMGGDEGDSAPSHDNPAIARYLDAHDLASVEDPQLTLLVSSELRQAYALASEVDSAAQNLVAAQGGTSRSALGRSLGHVETALTQTRDSLSLFDSLLGVMADGVNADQMAALTIDRDLLAGRADGLRQRADALAALRRNFPTAADGLS